MKNVVLKVCVWKKLAAAKEFTCLSSLNAESKIIPRLYAQGFKKDDQAKRPTVSAGGFRRAKKNTPIISSFSIKTFCDIQSLMSWKQ